MEVSDDTRVTVPLRNLVALGAALVIATAAYVELNSRITSLEHGQNIQDMTIADNADFVREWPLGLRGSLPADLQQDSQIVYIKEKQAELDQMKDRLNGLQIEINNVAGVNETQNQKIETLFDIWNQQVSD